MQHVFSDESLPESWNFSHKTLSRMRSGAIYALAVVAITVPVAAQDDVVSADPMASKFITIDPPGSTGTVATGINSAGTITGSYAKSNVDHGFVRSSAGAYTTFDPKGSVATFPSAINRSGQITGYYQTTPGFGMFHGFLRSATGAFKTFDPVGSTSTVPLSINTAGAITGNYQSSDNLFQSIGKTKNVFGRR
jgi:hypothetical protein